MGTTESAEVSRAPLYAGTGTQLSSVHGVPDAGFDHPGFSQLGWPQDRLRKEQPPPHPNPPHDEDTHDPPPAPTEVDKASVVESAPPTDDGFKWRKYAVFS